ncbi:MAG: hypothetical protein SNJ75_14960, partial [Gemmataceae bacterium]
EDGVLTLSVVLPSGGSMPGVVIMDSFFQQPIQPEVLVTNSGQLTLRVPNAVMGTAYTIQLVSTDLSNATSYLLLSQFSEQPAEIVNFLNGTIPTAGYQDARLTLEMPMYFQFSMQAYAQDVTLTIRTASGNVVTTFSVAAGQIATAPTLFLPAGIYTFEFYSTGATAFRLFGMDLSDPIGARRPDPLAPPGSFPAPTPPPPPPQLPPDQGPTPPNYSGPPQIPLPGSPVPPPPPPPPGAPGYRWWLFDWLPFRLF